MSGIIEEQDRVSSGFNKLVDAISAPAMPPVQPFARHEEEADLEFRFEHGLIRLHTPKHPRVLSSDTGAILGDDEFIDGTPAQNMRRLLMDALLS